MRVPRVVLLVFFAVTASGQKEAFAPMTFLSRLRPNTTDIKPEHKSPKPFRQLARIESAKPMALLWPRVLARHGVDKLQSQPARFQPSDAGGSRVKQNSKARIKTVPGREKTKAQSRVPVTALIALPGFH